MGDAEDAYAAALAGRAAEVTRISELAFVPSESGCASRSVGRDRTRRLTLDQALASLGRASADSRPPAERDLCDRVSVRRRIL